MKTLDKAYEPVVIEDEDDIGSNRSTNRPLVELVNARLSRRGMLRGFAGGVAAGVMGGTFASRVALAAAENDPSTLKFEQPQHVILDDHQVAPGYRADVLIRWGDKVLPDAPEWDPNNQTADAQAR
jgi:secreted PhoX family phosphatase